MKTLHLTLKKKWFDMIASGEKKEEYREFKPYWINRFVDRSDAPKEDPSDGIFTPDNIHFDVIENGFGFHEVVKAYFSKLQLFDTVTLRNGYSPTSPTVTLEFNGIEYGQGKPQWGAPEQSVFIIKLGNIINLPRLD